MHSVGCCLSIFILLLGVALGDRKLFEHTPEKLVHADGYVRSGNLVYVVMWLDKERLTELKDVDCKSRSKEWLQILNQWLEKHLNKTDIWNSFQRVLCSHSSAEEIFIYTMFDVTRHIPTFNYMLLDDYNHLFDKLFEPILEMDAHGVDVLYISDPTPPGFIRIRIDVKLQRNQESIDWNWTLYREGDERAAQIITSINQVTESVSEWLRFESGQGIHFAHIFPRRNHVWARLHVVTRDFTNMRSMSTGLNEATRRLLMKKKLVYHIGIPKTRLRSTASKPRFVWMTIDVPLYKSGEPMMWNQSFTWRNNSQARILQNEIIDQVTAVLDRMNLWSSDTVKFDTFRAVGNQLYVRLRLKLFRINKKSLRKIKLLLRQRSRNGEYQMTNTNFLVVQYAKPYRTNWLYIDSFLTKHGKWIPWNASFSQRDNAEARVLRNSLQSTITNVLFKHDFRADDVVQFSTFYPAQQKLSVRLIVKSYHLPDSKMLTNTVKEWIANIPILNTYQLWNPNIRKFNIDPTNLSKRHLPY